MIIEFQNTIEPKNHSTMALAIVITACALFFIPTTLIVLGYYSTQPTGTLISPLPQGTISQLPTPTPTEIIPSVTPEILPENLPIIAADNTATAESDIVPVSGSNITDKVATITANTTENVITDPDVTESSQIFLSPRPEDKALYSVKSKTVGEFVINVSEPSESERLIDYHIVNP